MRHGRYIRPRRTAMLVTCGFAVGAAIAHWLQPAPPPGPITGNPRDNGELAGASLPNASVPSPASGANPFGVASPTGSTAADRLAAYRVIAATEDSPTLEAWLADAAAQPKSASRDFAIDALLTRLFDLDAPGTLALAQSLALDPTFISTLARGLAESDPEAVTALLRSMTEPAAARRVALDLLDTLGYGSDTIVRLAAALPLASARMFRIEALERQAHIDPYRAFQAAFVLDGFLRAAALEKIGAVWAERDPHAAMASTQRLPHDLIFAYGRTVITTWAQSAPQSLIRYLETAPISDVIVGNIFEIQDVIMANPDSARTIVPRLPAMYRDNLLENAR